MRWHRRVADTLDFNEFRDTPRLTAIQSKRLPPQHPCHNSEHTHSTGNCMNARRHPLLGRHQSRIQRLPLCASLIALAALPTAHAALPSMARLARLAWTIHAQAPNISTRAAEVALKAYYDVKQQRLTEKPVLTIVDYSPPSNQRRLAVVDVQTHKVLFYTYVAQGKGSGLKYARHFSNTPNSLASSIGVYLTGNTFFGSDGYSLRVHGLDAGFNSNAYSRDIVVHSAWYVSRAFAQKYGRMGRSWGCFALSRKIERAVVNMIRGATVLVGYYPDRRWLHSSRFLRGPR